MIGTNSVVLTRYFYDPYGNPLSLSGSLAEAKLYRFSNKQWHPASGLVYYGYRFYAPEWQRWVNRNPIGEQRGMNVYRAFNNEPVCVFDSFGHSPECDARFDECMNGLLAACNAASQWWNDFYSDFKRKADDWNRGCKSLCVGKKGYWLHICEWACDVILGGAKKISFPGYAAGWAVIELWEGLGLQICENVGANCIAEQLREPGDKPVRIPIRPF